MAPGSRPGRIDVVDRVTELALAARDGNRHALEEFVRVTQRSVWLLCRHLGDPDTVEDLVQDTYLRALRSLPRFRNDGPARAWLLRIARNTCADATRSRIRRRRRMAEGEAPDTPVVSGSWEVVEDLLRGISAERREAFVLTQFVGLSYAEAAAVAGCAVGTIRSRVSRAREDLLALLDDETRGATGSSG